MSSNTQLINFFFEFSNARKWVEKSFQNPPRSSKLFIPARINRNFKVSEFQISGKSVVTFQPQSNAGNTHILFFHGGAYLLEGSSMHWKLLETLVLETRSKGTYFDYPLAPENTYKETFYMLQQAFKRLTFEYPSDRFILIGDSAGGGLALAFAQKLLTENAAIQPVKNVLFSPWLDLSMRNPEIQFQEIRDKLLPLKGLIEAGKKYSGGEDTSNYLLSPINGKLDGLSETIVFYGTQELFYPDCKLLLEMTKNNPAFIFHEFPEMQHDWVIFPGPETKKALRITSDFILK